MSSPHEADQIHTEQLWLRKIYSCKGELQAWDCREYIGKQTTSSAIWTAFGSQAVLWLLHLKTQDVIALEAFDKL